MGQLENIHDFISHVNPFGALVKVRKERSGWWWTSTTGVNDAMVQLPLKLPTVREALGETTGTPFLEKRDLKNGFHHVVLSEPACKYMGFQHPETGHVERWMVLPFGVAQSPAIF